MRSPRLILVQPDDPSIRLIALTRGQVAIVDADRFEWAMQWLWHARYYPHTGAFYAARSERQQGPVGQRTLFLHRQLLGEPNSRVDHADGNTLDCRIQNLRLCTPSQNRYNHKLQSNNTTGHSGVYRSGDKWRAEIFVDGKHLRLGSFASKDEAIAKRKAAEIEYHGEFAGSARQRQPPKKPPVRDDGVVLILDTRRNLN